jgi:hypothetical protein
MPSNLQNDAPAHTGASFSLFPLSRKCGPKVVPLAPFWDAFGHPNRTKSPKEAFKNSSGNQCDFKCHLDQKGSQNDVKMTWVFLALGLFFAICDSLSPQMGPGSLQTVKNHKKS